jgi:hypothetical protein
MLRQSATSSTNFSCEFCGKILPTRHRVRQHISNTVLCRRKNEAKFLRITGHTIPRPDRKTSASASSDEGSGQEGDEDAVIDPVTSMNAPIDFDAGPSPSPASPPRVEASASSRPPPSSDPRIEDIPEEDDTPRAREQPSSFKRFIDAYPEPAGIDIGVAETVFERIRREQHENGEGRYGAFKDEKIWEVAQFLVDCVGHNDANRFLKLSLVRLFCWCSC